jgi:hypothetical protein
MLEQSLEELIERELDMPYVGRVAAAVASALRADTVIAANWQPGDGTCYRLVFVPIENLPHAPPRIAPLGDDEVPRAWDERCSFGLSREPGKALVTWVDNGASGFDLSCGGFVGGYVAKCFRTTEGSGVALALLFNLIAEKFQELGTAAL